MRKINFFIIPFLIFCSCAQLPRPVTDAGETGPITEIPVLPEKDYLTIIAAGDNLYHNVMIRDGEEGDYESIYSEILALVKPADIAFINQETLLGGIDFGFTGYPLFNSPQKLGHAVAAAGFNVVNHANNHVMDKGERAVFVTMDFWDTYPEITVLGIHRSREQRDLPKLIEKNNITLGFLSYTFSTNGIPVPSGKPHLVSFINTEIMAKEIDNLRPLCDFLVVSMHWGEEYQHNYNKTQEQLAAFLAAHRVDLVIGHHPHVLQPVKYITRPDGGTMLCFFSLGNFASAQTQNPTLLGALAYVRIKKIPVRDDKTTSKIVFEDAGAIPLVTHYEGEYTGFKIFPLFAYTDELLKKHRQHRGNKDFTMDYLSGIASKVLGEKLLQSNPLEQEE